MPDEPKSKCAKCGAEMLAATANRTGGLCMPCKQGQPRVTLTSEQAEAELELAAAALETRAKLLRIETKTISSEQWDTLAPHLQMVPDWYRRMLTRFPLYGVGLEYRDWEQPYVRLFSFAGPDDFNSTLAEDSDCAPLVEAGFVIVGYESDGSLWVIERPFHPSSPVYFCWTTPTGMAVFRPKAMGWYLRSVDSVFCCVAWVLARLVIRTLRTA